MRQGLGGRQDRRSRRDHDEYRLLIAAGIDGRLDPDSAAALEAHLATCESCRADQAAMLDDHAWLADPAAVSWPRPTVRDFVLDAARAPRIPRTSDRPRSLVPVMAAGTIAALVAVVAFGLWRGTSGPGATSLGASNGGVVPSQSARATAVPAPSPMPLARLIPEGACAPAIASLTAWWPGEPDGADLISGRTATLHGGATTTPGLVMSAFDFDGRAAYAQVEEDPGLEFGTSDFTIMLWVRFDDTSGERVLLEQWLDKGGGAPRSAGWTLTKLTDNILLFTSESSVGGQGASTQVLQIEPGIWYHIAVRRAGRDIAILVNDAGPWNSRGGTVIDIRADRPVLFARRGDDRGFLLDGALDEIKIVVGRALFDSDIRAEYLAGSTGTCRS